MHTYIYYDIDNNSQNWQLSLREGGGRPAKERLFGSTVWRKSGWDHR